MERMRKYIWVIIAVLLPVIVYGTQYIYENLDLDDNNLTTTGTVSAPTLSMTGTGTINGLDAIDATSEATLESALDIAGDVSSTGMATTVIGSDKILESMLKSVNAATDEYVLTYESTTGDFEWEDNTYDSANFTGTNWTDLTDSGATTLHSHTGGGGATTALDNLASVAINTSLISDADNTDDLGSSANEWKDLYIDGVAWIDNFGESLISDTDLTDDLGSETIRWSEVYGGRLNLSTGAVLADTALRQINQYMDITTSTPGYGIYTDIIRSSVSNAQIFGHYLKITGTTGFSGPNIGFYAVVENKGTGTAWGFYGEANHPLAGSNYGGGFDGSAGSVDNADVYLINRTLKAGATYTFPAADGSSDQHLTTNGSGALSWAAATVASGTKIYLNDNETRNTLTADGVGLAITLAANTYSQIKAAAEGYMVGAANTASTWNVWIRDNTVQKGNKTVLDVPATGAGDTHTVPFSISTIFTETTSQSIDVYCDEVVDGSSLVINKLELEGIK